MIEKYLEEIKETWDLSSEELLDIKRKMAHYAVDAVADSHVLKEAQEICATSDI